MQWEREALGEAMTKSHVANITPGSYEVGVLPAGHVGLRFHCAEVEALLPALDLRLRLSPSEARDLAQLLLSKADEALGEHARYPTA